MELPRDVNQALRTRGENAAVARLCRQYAMSRPAAVAWVQACHDHRLREGRQPVSTGRVVAVLLAAFVAGMGVAALGHL